MKHAWMTMAILAPTMSAMPGCALVRSGGVETIFFVDDAASISASCIDVGYREAALACHRIRDGDNLVVGLRRYSPNRTDREGFLKLTFVIDRGVADGEVVELPSDRVKAAFGSGLSFMPGGSGCHGQATSGTVSFARTGKEALKLHADVVFDLRSAPGWPDHCKPYAFRSELEARRSTLDRMGPWEGVVNGESEAEESHPSSKTK
ncbi:hypothetical protein ACQQ2N_02890 [Dokdonella sp. MW10]|uniref:hypothetical protein n=1 Tax=Dokdonella sp. MW10 TaxID=2992926 RepID=UPI003F80F58B